MIYDQLWPPLEKVTVDQERELHKPNSFNYVIVNRCDTNLQQKLRLTILTAFSSFVASLDREME